MKSLQLFWKKLMVVLLVAAMAFSAVLPAVQAEAAESVETEETDAAEVVETAETEETATEIMETAAPEPQGDRELTPVSESAATSRQADTLVDFTFLTPATKVILDGEPLMILPDTLTAHLEYYDQDGTLFDQDIRYSSTAARTGSSWKALQYFLGTGSYALDPQYDSSTGGWYYTIRGNRYDVPIQEIQMSDSDALELFYSEDYWGVDDEWPRGRVRLYKVMSNEALRWDDLYMNQTPVDSSYISRGSRLGGACTFSKEDPADADSHRTESGEYYYYANYYYGERVLLQADCRPSCEPDYIADPVYDIVLQDVNKNGTSFEFQMIILEEGWYRVSYLISSMMKASADVRLDPTTCDTSIEMGIFQRSQDGTAWNNLTKRSEPMYLPRGTATFSSTVYAANPSGYYAELLLEATVEKLTAGDIFTEKIGVIPYGSKNEPWNWNRTITEYSYGFEDMYFAPDEWGDYDFKYPSPASLTGRTDEDCLFFKYACYMKSQSGSQESFPFSYCALVPFSEMNLDGSFLLRYPLSVFGEITAELLDPDGNAMDLTSTEELAGGKYTMHIVSRCGDTVMEEQNVLIGIPPRDKYEILESADVSLTYQTGKSAWADYDEEFTQSAEDPDEYTLSVSCRNLRKFSILSCLMQTLSMQVSYQQTLTKFTYDQDFVTDMITGPDSMEEKTFLLKDLIDVHPTEQESKTNPAYLGDPSTDVTDYLEVHLYDQDGTTEYTDLWYGELEPGTYLMTVTTGMHQYEKRIFITLKGRVDVQSIELSESEITLRPNKTYQLQYAVNPSDASFPELTWEAEDHQIVLVEDGVIETRGEEGDTTVTAYAEDRTISATCLVHVRKQRIESVKLSETEITLRPEETMQLGYEIIPADNDYPDAWWTLEDESIAEIAENGAVTAKSVGDTTLTLHAQDGEITAICKVHVIQYPPNRIVMIDENWNEVSSGGTTEISVGSGGSFPIHYLAKTVLGNEYWLEEEDLKNWTVSITNSNPAVIAIDASNVFAPSYNSLKQGTSVLTVNVNGDGWEKTAKFNIFVQFQDVTQKSKYYYAPVYWAARKGITNGYGGWEFGVGWNCTREDMVTFLWRMKGKPSVTAADKKTYHFPDVESGKYYENAVVWAAKNGITKGYSSGAYAGKFGVGLEVTREDAVTFLYRVAGKPTVSAADLKQYTFKDIKSTAYYAKPVAWAAKKGITKGYSSGAYAGKFGVGLKVTREDIVTFMYRYTGGK